MGLNKVNIGGNSKYHQGYYSLINPDKYIGDPTNIVYRSSLEFKFCRYCDTNQQIKKWGSEVIIIPYNDHDGKVHRYFPDFYIEVIYPDKPGKLDKFVIEVKPYAETIAPVIPKTKSLKKMKNFEYQFNMFRKNVYKWSQALEWCKGRDMIFKIITEKNM